MRVLRPRGKPPSVIISTPQIPVGALSIGLKDPFITFTPPK